MIGLTAISPTTSNAFDFTTTPNYIYYHDTDGTHTTTTTSSYIKWTSSGSSGHAEFDWFLDPNQTYYFRLITNAVSGYNYADAYYNGSGHTRLEQYNSGKSQKIFGFTTDDTGTTLSILMSSGFGGPSDYVEITGAPEIDGGKLPLAALLLGLVAVIAQRKRKAFAAA